MSKRFNGSSNRLTIMSGSNSKTAWQICGQSYCQRLKILSLYLKKEKTNTNSKKEFNMNIHLGLTPILSLAAGILILVVPRLLSYIVAIYLIAVGLVGLFGARF